jgi:hypothetical protein
MGGRAASNSLALTHGTQGDKTKKVTFFNAGMRGKKTSEYDGGHRVPFFLRWPAGGYEKGRDIDALTHSTDVLPTLIELCALEAKRKKEAFDGHSLVPLIKGKEDALDDRKVVVQYRAIFKKWSGAVLWKKWRLVNGEELYNVSTDPGQANDVYDKFPDVVRTMRDHYEAWVSKTEPIMEQTNFVTVGTPKEPVTWMWKRQATMNYHSICFIPRSTIHSTKDLMDTPMCLLARLQRHDSWLMEKREPSIPVPMILTPHSGCYSPKVKDPPWKDSFWTRMGIHYPAPSLPSFVSWEVW